MNGIDRYREFQTRGSAGPTSRKAITQIGGLSTTTGFFGDLSAEWDAATYRNLAKKGYRNPYVYRAINFVADALAEIPLQLRRDTGGGETEGVDDHPALDLINRPNESTTRSMFFRKMIGHWYFGGEVNLQTGNILTGDRSGMPTKMFLHRPDRFRRFETDRDDMIEGYHFSLPNGDPVFYDTDQMTRILNWHPLKDNHGYPVVQAAFMSVQLQEEGLNWNMSTFQNKGRIPGFFKYTGRGDHSDTKFQRLKEETQQQYRKDAKNALPGFLDADYDFMEVGQTVGDADWLEQNRLEGVRIAIALGIDPALLGDSSHKTYSNFETALRAAYILNIVPTLKAFLDEFNQWLLPKFPDGDSLFFAVNEDEIRALQEDRTELYNRLVQGVEGTVITPDEARQELGFDPLEGAADQLYSAFNRVPLEGLAAPGGEMERSLSRLGLMDEREFYRLEDAILNGAGGDGETSDLPIPDLDIDV